MKVTISMPDSSEKRARRAAERSRMNFSQFMSRAADEYSQKVESQSVTDQINAVLEAAGHDDSNRMAARASHETLRRSEW